MIAIINSQLDDEELTLCSIENNERITIYNNFILLNTGTQIVVNYSVPNLKKLVLNDFSIVIIVETNFQEITFNNIDYLNIRKNYSTTLKLNSVERMSFSAPNMRMSNIHGIPTSTIPKHALNDIVAFQHLTSRFSSMNGCFILDTLSSFLY
jgi:hypothetical protein